MQIDKLSDAIMQELEDYSEDVAKAMKESVKKASEDCMTEIKNHITFTQRSGKYVKSFKLKTSYEDENTLRKTWYVSGKEYRLTHLLEYGHAKVNGGRTRAFPHIKYGEKIANENLVKYIKGAIK